MPRQSIKSTISATLTTLFLTFNLVSGQEPELKIKSPVNGEKTYRRETPVAKIDRGKAFGRSNSHLEKAVPSGQAHRRSRAGISIASRKDKIFSPVATIEVQSFGTGGGDIVEIEPNGTIAQNISLPVNIFGEIRVADDVDYFAISGLAGEPVVIEPFAARLSGSELIADIALFNTAGQQLARDIGDEENDPVIRYTPASDGVLIVGIADADNFGGRSFDYLLNITRGGDLMEREVNDRTAQSIAFLPVTVFGDIDNREDVDFFSFIAEAGQTLIVDIDAEVLGSRLDSILNLTDPQSGIELFYSDQEDGDDSRFNIVLPYTGRYVVGVGSFNTNSEGFYRLNFSLVPKIGAPTITNLIPVAKKLFDVQGSDFSSGAVIEVNGIPRKTTVQSGGVLRGKAKLRAGDVVTVANAPDGRRSNPLIAQ